VNNLDLKLAEPEHILALSWGYFAGRLGPLDAATPELRSWFGRLLAIFLPNIDELDLLPVMAGFVFGFDAEVVRNLPENAAALGADSVRMVLGELADEVRVLNSAVSAEDFKSLMQSVQEATGVSGKELFGPVRIAITGALSGPELEKIIPLIEDGAALLGIASVQERIERFVGA
jgi:nondiscriminating glutamyl-tRNA synthetase